MKPYSNSNEKKVKSEKKQSEQRNSQRKYNEGRKNAETEYRAAYRSDNNTQKNISKKDGLQGAGGNRKGTGYSENKDAAVRSKGASYSEYKGTAARGKENRYTENKSNESRGNEKRYTVNKFNENRSSESGKPENGSWENRSSENRSSENRIWENRNAENRDSSNKGTRGIGKGTRYSESKSNLQVNKKEFGNKKQKLTGKDTSRDRNRKESSRSYEEKNSRKSPDGSCPHRRDCGSCRIQEKSYKEHLKDKQGYVSELLKSYCPVEPIIGMEDPRHYRNKVHVVFDHDRRGNAVSGVYEEGTHRVIAIESCLIHNEKADEIIASIRGLLKSFKIKTYDEDTGYGLLRHVLIRTGYHSKEIMVVLVIGSPIFPSKNNFVKALRKLHPEISTIVVNVNDKNTSMVLGEKEQVIYGKGFIEDSLCDKVFRISPKSFYQVNPQQTEILYRKAIEMAGLTGKETVLDAYCGTGTIGLIASDKADKVIGVELNKDAVADAKVNAKRNQVSNIQFYQKDASEFISQLAAQEEKIDVVFMDPPRAGSDERFLDSLAVLKPERVVYISCNPLTLERDVAYLTKKGYKAKKLAPVDMFPWTNHVETCVLLTRKNSASYNVEITVDIDV
ncbi:23S rRNA (uracil(1939)-C(5))-methyltransferase RlmD [Clostridium sp. KNHs205]|uniref:23S rRNA (uracil(1939)-C(5))-methyltransferase RlmD n=1 Tax=Clostridium sp. KNHs205 TaxID=1449050 RepID=UPI0009DD1077|nr:23S rRNA (uracil(1939)-C(5))-methyltransferase RlmD [Clostridium sp. KNHs205]